MKKNQATITIPKKTFQNLLKAGRIFELAQNELEDYLMFQSPKFLKKMRKAHNEDKNGTVLEWGAFRRKHGV